MPEAPGRATFCHPNCHPRKLPGSCLRVLGLSHSYLGYISKQSAPWFPHLCKGCYFYLFYHGMVWESGTVPGKLGLPLLEGRLRLIGPPPQSHLSTIPLSALRGSIMAP